jgi:hypothetical protein
LRRCARWWHLVSPTRASEFKKSTGGGWHALRYSGRACGSHSHLVPVPAPPARRGPFPASPAAVPHTSRRWTIPNPPLWPPTRDAPGWHECTQMTARSASVLVMFRSWPPPAASAGPSEYHRACHPPHGDGPRSLPIFRARGFEADTWQRDVPASLISDESLVEFTLESKNELFANPH